MSKFEDELKSALRRQQPSPDFTNRLMARIAELPAADADIKQEKLRENRRRGDGETGRRGDWWRKIAALFRPPQMKWAMAGAMAVLLIATIVGVNRYRQHQAEVRRQAEIAAEAEGQRAKEQVMLAMRIASAKLNVAQKKVKQTTQRDDGQQAGRQQN